MKLKEFINIINGMMEQNEWQNKTTEFCTIDRCKLLFLSIYEEENKIIIDIGTDKDSDDRNKCLLGK